jgi:hypothetical protein
VAQDCWDVYFLPNAGFACFNPSTEALSDRKLASISATAFASVSLVGAGLLLSGYLSAGTLTAASGAVPTVYCIKLAKGANDRLDRIFEELND